MNFTNGLLAAVAFVFLGLGNAWCFDLPFLSKTGPCAPAAYVQSSAASLATFGGVSHRISPQFFGFNVELMEFQLGLFDKSSQNSYPELVRLLKPFDGAVYRYPGGAPSNAYSWRDATGPIGGRASRQFNSWLPARPVTFGVDEYRQFLKDVGGTGWWVVNMQGARGKEMPISALANDAKELSAYLRLPTSQALPSISHWELGNELDRHPFFWRPEKFVERALALKSAISSGAGAAAPTLSYVALAQEYSAQAKRGVSADEYNKAVFRGLPGDDTHLALHLYYDAIPGGLTLPQYLDFGCRAIKHATEARGGRAPQVWITEHARVPEGAFDGPDWKHLWPQTADLQAAISVADLYIAATAMPQIKGAFVHALHATGGPWPIFHKDGNGQLRPSTVYWGMRVLRESMLPEVLTSQIQSRHVGGYKGGYDVRAALMRSPSEGLHSLWAINRSQEPAVLKILHAPFKNRSFRFTHSRLSGANPGLRNHLVNEVLPDVTKGVLHFNASGEAAVTLPPYSVNGLMLSALQP